MLSLGEWMKTMAEQEDENIKPFTIKWFNLIKKDNLKFVCSTEDSEQDYRNYCIGKNFVFAGEDDDNAFWVSADNKYLAHGDCGVMTAYEIISNLPELIFNKIDNVEKYCGTCIYKRGEECDGHHEGREVYSDTEACIGYSE